MLMDENEALHLVDEQLDAALAGFEAPAAFDRAVYRRIRETRISRLPEVLDWIGWVALFALVLVGALIMAPPALPSYVWLTLSALLMAPALWFGVRSLRDLSE